MKKNELHPRNRHRDRYDFKQLTHASPELRSFVSRNAYGDESIDFADPAAVKALNRALLRLFYGVIDWDIPAGYLCPPIPGRADYIHSVADLVPGRGRAVRVLDVGTGANCVYPLIGHREYGWSFVGTETDPVALASARAILDRNPEFAAAIELRPQPDRSRIFDGVIRSEERFDLTICNPPFHASAEEAATLARRKWHNLGKRPARGRPARNFGGTSTELWCEGGERAFILRMIEESVRYRAQCGWFTTLVSKESNLPGISHALNGAGVRAQEMLEMAQGQKISRVMAWTFAG